VSACGSHLDGPFHVMLTFDLAEIEFLLGGPGCVPVVRRSNWLQDQNICARQVDRDPFPAGPARNALLQMAEVTRSLLSLTAASGSPTTAILSAFPHPA